MKWFSGALLVLFFLSAGCQQKKESVESRDTVRARKGELVWIVTNTIKPQARGLYEKFMKEVFLHTMQTSKVDSTRSKFLHARYLYPEVQNEDSSWTYVFILESYSQNSDYSVFNVLKEKYGDIKAREYDDIYQSCLKGRPTLYKLIQSEY